MFAHDRSPKISIIPYVNEKGAQETSGLHAPLRKHHCLNGIIRFRLLKCNSLYYIKSKKSFRFFQVKIFTHHRRRHHPNHRHDALLHRNYPLHAALLQELPEAVPVVAQVAVAVPAVALPEASP